MKLTSYFKNFLDKEVNLNADRIKRLDERTETITNVLKESELLKDKFLDVIPQGSYAHKTIIKPVRDTDEFDADILLYIEESTEWQPCDYVEKVYQLFRSNSIYKDMVSRKTRCVTIDYANDFHIDVVPFLDRSGRKYVTNRHENNFELTDPEAYTEWLDERNRITKHHFTKVIRLVKYLRDYKRTFSVKSIILNTILGTQINDIALLENENCYDDTPTTLYSVMKKLKTFLEANYYMPVIADPGNTGENFGDRWDQAGWSNFRTKMIYYSDKIIEAYDETELEKSLEKWKFIFGDQFKKSEIGNEIQKQLSERSLETYHNTEQQITDLGFLNTINPKYHVRLQGRVTHMAGFREFVLSTTGNKVPRNRNILFSIKKCNVPEPYQIFWKVLNRGEEAIKRDCVRGQISEGSVSHNETTLFRGGHFVECYIIKDGICVTSDRQSVTIV